MRMWQHENFEYRVATATQPAYLAGVSHDVKAPMTNAHSDVRHTATQPIHDQALRHTGRVHTNTHRKEPRPGSRPESDLENALKGERAGEGPSAAAHQVPQVHLQHHAALGPEQPML